MTTAEQQALAQVRARIECNLAEIAQLARDSRLPPGDFFRRFLDLTLGAVDGMGGCVWVVGEGQAKRIAEISFASSGYDQPAQKAWIEKVLNAAVSSGQPCVVAVQDQSPAAPDSIGNSVPYPFFYMPVALDGEVLAVLQVWLKQAGDPRSYGDISSFLGGLVQHACFYLRGAEQMNLRRELMLNRKRLSMQEAMMGELDPKMVTATAANYLVDLLPCALGAVLREKGDRWHLESASNQESVDPASDQSQTLARLAGLLPRESETGFFPADGEENPELKNAVDDWFFRGV